MSNVESLRDLYSGPVYKINSFAPRGQTYEVIRSDGRTVILQDSDGQDFKAALNTIRLHDDSEYEKICAFYF